MNPVLVQGQASPWTRASWAFLLPAGPLSLPVLESKATDYPGQPLLSLLGTCYAPYRARWCKNPVHRGEQAPNTARRCSLFPEPLKDMSWAFLLLPLRQYLCHVEDQNRAGWLALSWQGTPWGRGVLPSPLTAPSRTSRLVSEEARGSREGFKAGPFPAT